MKNKILMFLGFLLMIGLVSASTQTYDVKVNVNWVGNMSTLGINADINEEGGIITNPLIFNVDVNYVNYSNIDCHLLFNDGIAGDIAFTSDGAGNGAYATLQSGLNDWDIYCNDETSPSDYGQIEVEDVNLTFGGIQDGNFYFNDSVINGTLEFTKDINFSLDGEPTTIVNFDSNTGEFELEVDEPGHYILTAQTTYFPDIPIAGVDFYVGSAHAEFEYTTAALNENTDVGAEINLGGLPGTHKYNLTIGNSGSGWSSIDSYTFSWGSSISSDFESSNAGTYSIRLKLNIDGDEYIINGGNSLTVSGSTVANDDEDPVITMVYPSWEQIIRDSEIEFTYKIEDNIDLELCKLKIYNASEASGVYMEDELVFPLTSSDVDLAEENPTGTSDEISLKLVDFDEGGYIWKVECEDGAGNDDNDYNYFYVDLNGTYSGTSTTPGANEYAREGEVQDLVDTINSFLEAEDNFGMDEKKALDLLGIGDDMKLYKKKLLQIDQDLKYNLKFMDADTYKKRVDEIDEEITEIRKNIVLSISVDDTYEYSKNNPSIPIGTVISDYFEATGHEVGGSILRRLTKTNEELQSKLSSRVDAIKLEIEYVDDTKELVVVNKKLDFGSGVYDILLEVIPEEVSKEVTFISSAEDVGNSIWEINTKDLNNDEITYYFYGDLSLQKIEKTESILFSEDIGEGSMITGFVVGVGDSLGLGILPVLIGALFMGYVGFIVFGKAKLEVWKKEPNVVRILDLMKSTKLLLRENNVVDSRANYAKMSEIYKVLPSKTKHFFFSEIKMIRLAIDKKDVINLMKEYEQAKNAGRIEDASELHGKISAVYKKLPKKFQEKVYQRLIKNELK